MPRLRKGQPQVAPAPAARLRTQLPPLGLHGMPRDRQPKTVSRLTEGRGLQGIEDRLQLFGGESVATVVNVDGDLTLVVLRCDADATLVRELDRVVDDVLERRR